MGNEVRGAVEANADCEGLASFSGCYNRAIVPFNVNIDVEVIDNFDIDLLNIVTWVDVLVGIGFNLNDVNTCCRCPCCVAAAVLKRGLSALEDSTGCKRQLERAIQLNSAALAHMHKGMHIYNLCDSTGY